MGIMYYKDANGNVYPVNKGPKGDVGPGGGAADVAEHEAKPNPHPQYLTPEEANGLAYLPLSGGTVTGDIGLDGNTIYGLPEPINPDHASTKGYTDSKWTAWFGTQASYDAIPTKDPNTLYIIV